MDQIGAVNAQIPEFHDPGGFDCVDALEATYLEATKRL